ncbi:MAG: dimethylarginine dimethylaminohydrolase family protein [Pseudobdellovibrionaceae bacterium]
MSVSNPFTEVLMVHPQYFDIEYAINPYMKDSAGNLNKVDRQLAVIQWQNLKTAYERIGFSVSVLDGVEKLPDMVFAANQSFPFLKGQKKSVILSRMRSEYRQKEVAYFQKFYQSKGYDIYEISNDLTFEGNGDALIQPGTNEIWGGYGYRTDLKVYDQVAKITGMKVHPLRLNSEFFYHLDTCFSILDAQTVAYVPSAFDSSAIKLIQQKFKRNIEVHEKEALDFFATNCHSPDGKHVILHPGAERFRTALKDHGFVPVELDTSEYKKSGGSVFCMKMMMIK